MSMSMMGVRFVVLRMISEDLLGYGGGRGGGLWYMLV
jgi:hypothetical protein